MKVTRLETLRLEGFPNLLWVRVRADQGIVGLGETFFGARAVATAIKQRATSLARSNPLAP